MSPLTQLKLTRQHDLNDKGRDFFVGDIHGNHSLLMTQLNDINFEFEIDRLFAVGDIIDRGEDSEKCLELLIEPWFFSAIGNHEYLFLQGFENKSYWDILFKNGGEWIKQWLNNPSQLLAWAHLIRVQMPLSLTVKTSQGKIGVSHAEAPPRWSQFNDSTNLDILPILWKRLNSDSQKKLPIAVIDAVVHGHTQVNECQIINNQIWADTVQKTGKLSILSVEQVFNYINNYE